MCKSITFALLKQGWGTCTDSETNCLRKLSFSPIRWDPSTSWVLVPMHQYLHYSNMASHRTWHDGVIPPHHGHCGAPPRSPPTEPGHKSFQLLGMLPAASSLLSPSPGNFFLQRESSHPNLLSLPGRKPAPNDIVQRRISPVLILDLSEGPSPLQSSCGTIFQFSSPFCQILHRCCSWGHSLINFRLPNLHLRPRKPNGQYPFETGSLLRTSCQILCIPLPLTSCSISLVLSTALNSLRMDGTWMMTCTKIGQGPSISLSLWIQSKHWISSCL